MKSSKEDFLRKFNESFMTEDIPFILDSVTEDVEWTMVGDMKFEGRKSLADFFDQMDGSEKLLDTTIENIIATDTNAAVNGSMKMKQKSGDIKIYAFCDVYEFSETTDGKISKLTSYLVEISEN